MSNESKLDHSLAEALQFGSAMAQMSETELARLLYMVESLEADFRLIPLRDSESVKAVAMAQNLLKIWNTEVDRILLDKQETDLYEQLHNREDEGGLVNPTPSRRVVVRMEQGKRHLVWADIE